MVRTFCWAVVSCVLMLGCQSSTPTESVKPDADKGGDIKVHTPRVDVDIDRGQNKKVDVDVHRDR